MRYITSVRIVNAFYQALAKVTKCSDYWNSREINTEMAQRHYDAIYKCKIQRLLDL